MSGQVTAWSSAPFFDTFDAKNAAIATVLENDIVSVDYSLVSASQQVRGTASTVGAPVGVTDGLDFIWAVTKSPNQFIRYVAPTLAQPTAITLDETPVAVAGAKLATGTSTLCAGPPPVDPFYIVVAEITSAGGGDIRSFNQGNPQSVPIVSANFDGEPVALAVASITGVEYAFVATKNPNRLYQIDVARPDILDAFISLDDVEPVRITLGGTSGSVASGTSNPDCDDTDECLSCTSPLTSGTAFVHVLVKNP